MYLEYVNVTHFDYSSTCLTVADTAPVTLCQIVFSITNAIRAFFKLIHWLLAVFEKIVVFTQGNGNKSFNYVMSITCNLCILQIILALLMLIFRSTKLVLQWLFSHSNILQNSIHRSDKDNHINVGYNMSHSSEKTWTAKWSLRRAN